MLFCKFDLISYNNLIIFQDLFHELDRTDRWKIVFIRTLDYN